MSAEHNGTHKIGVLVVNLGTPTSWRTSAVRRYLGEFLMDRRVIDISFWFRWLLVRLIIVPFRGPKSAQAYKQLWTERGSPLMYHTQSVCEKLFKQLGENYVVEMAMRYQQPSIAHALAKLQKQALSKLIVLPLYPQYASATTGSVHEKVMQVLSTWEIIPELHFVSQFHTHPAFIHAWVTRAQAFFEEHPTRYERYVFSYHGLPVSQIQKGSFDNHCQLTTCCDTRHPNNQYCYRAQCLETTRQLITALQLNPKQCLNGFQSRLGKREWLQPYMSNLLEELIQNNIKHIAVFSPAFVMDCLETTIEIGEEYKEIFLEHGGKTLDLVPSLNDQDAFVQALEDIIHQYAS